MTKELHSFRSTVTQAVLESLFGGDKYWRTSSNLFQLPRKQQRRPFLSGLDTGIIIEPRYLELYTCSVAYPYTLQKWLKIAVDEYWKIKVEVNQKILELENNSGFFLHIPEATRRRSVKVYV